MSDSRGLTNEKINYPTLSSLINWNYCKVNNYDFIYYQPYYKEIDVSSSTNCVNPTTGELRHTTWSKLLSVYQAMELGHEYVVYIDSDAILRTLDYRVETFIDKHLNGNDFIFLDNSPNPSVHIDDSPCAGFFIVKNCEKTKKDISKWYNVNDPSLDRNTFHEQSVLHWYILKDIKFTNAIELHFHENPGQFVRHMHSGIQGHRIPYFTNVIKELNLNLEDISEINWIQYDTSSIKI